MSAELAKISGSLFVFTNGVILLLSQLIRKPLSKVLFIAGAMNWILKKFINRSF